MSAIDIVSCIEQVFLHDKVRAGFDWMTVTAALRPHPGGRLGLALSITSSFGVLGYEWPDLGADTSEPPQARAHLFLATMSRERFLARVLQHDRPEPDFEASLDAFRRAASDALEDLDPDGRCAQALRESILRCEECIADIDPDLGCDHRIHLLLSCPDVWDILPDAAETIRRDGPSLRRRQAEGFYDRLWAPYIAHLASRSQPGSADPISSP